MNRPLLPPPQPLRPRLSGSNSSAPLALLGGGALILLAGVALFLGLRSRKKVV